MGAESWNGTIWAIHGAATTNARFNTTKASPRREGGNASAGHGASAPAIVAASARVRGTLSGLNDAPVTTTAAANAATHASTGRRASRVAARRKSAAPTVQPAASWSQSPIRRSLGLGSSWAVAKPAAATARTLARTSEPNAAR